MQWERQLPRPAWASPVIVDDVLLVGDCLEGNFHAFDMSDPDVVPPELWSVHLGGCIEATPAVWNGKIYIGSRAGPPLRPRLRTSTARRWSWWRRWWSW